MSNDRFVKVIEDAGFDDFGFLVIRKEFGDEDTWDRWQDGFYNLIETSMQGRAAGAEALLDKLMIAMLDEPQMQGATWNGVADFFEECRENNDMVPPGLDLGFCLAVDHAAMNSLLNPTPGQDPWIWAVDVEYDFEAANGDQNSYPGYFKVAVSSLITDFYPALAGPRLEGKELWPLAQPIWKHAA